jgi:radical SAM superfamily enzyme YgiQ (UPF0313 family)
MKILFLRHHDKLFNTFVPAFLSRFMSEKIPALGISYVAANLERAGYDVRFIDSMAQGLTAQQTKKAIMDYGPDIVGITAMTVTFLGALEAARISKECGATVVMGGPHFSIFPRESLFHKEIDYAVFGEGENTMLNLVRAIEGNSPVENIKGLIWRENGEVRVNEPAIIDDLESLPIPARHLTPVNSYRLIGAHKPFATMLTQRGCPFKCGYCATDNPMRKVRFRKVESVLDEMELLVNEFGTREINFVVETFTLKKDFTVALCEGILKRNIKVAWQAPTRVDCVDLELLKLMHRAGCWQLRFGIESGNQRILDLMNKKVTLEMIESAVNMTKKAGMRTVGYFILGYVDENAQSVCNTIQFAKKLALDSAVFYLGVPYYKTNFHELAVERGLIDENYWTEWVMGKRTDPLPFLIPDAEMWLQKAYSDYYYRPTYILKRLFNIRSPQDLCENLFAGSSMLLSKIRSQFQQ